MFALQLAAQPSNDACADAIALSCGVTLNNQNTINAVLEDATSCLNLNGEDVWYTFEGDGNEVSFFVDITNGVDTYVEIYESTNNECSGITLGNCIYGAGYVNGSIGTTVVFTEIGTTYYIRVGNELNNGATEFTITANCNACTDPAGLDVTNLSTTSVNLSWVELAAATTWNIEWGPTDFTQGTGNLITGTTTNPQFLDNLTPGAVYDFYVQSDCGADGTSNWVGPFKFTATCLITAPYTETFQDFTVSPADFLEGNCWTGTPGTINGYNWEVAAGTDTSSTDTGPSPTVTDGNYMFTEASAALGGEVTNLISPFVDISPITNPELSFDYHMFGVQMGTIEVLINNGTSTVSVFSLSGEQQTAEDEPFLRQTIDLSSYAGQQIQVTFKATMGDDFRSDIAIDNVTFGEAVLSVEEFEEKNQLTYYPNPVENVLTLNSLSNIQNVQIYTMLGQEVKQYTPNSKETTIDMSDLKSGAYFVKVMVDNAFETIRVLKK